MTSNPASVQAQHVDYQLHSLGWKAFQDLCVTIINEVLRQTIQVFLSSRDGGRDGAFHGSWNPDATGGVRGSFTVQCKFTSKRDRTISLAGLSDELSKAHRLAGRGLADNYVLMTNHHVSGVAEENIREAFLEIKGIRHFLLLGSEWITLKIRESPRLRTLVPRVYGLGDLSQILDERAYAQAREILSFMREDLAKFVVTDVYRKSAKALINHGFVLLLGEPASGKSTIAASLALGAIDIWGCSTLKIRDADDFIRHWNPNEPRQFFSVDDVFGTTQYQRETASSWNRVFPSLLAAIRKGARVLFTSRDYIYGAALGDLKTSAFPLLSESQVVIDVQKLAKSEREQILYNHIKLGNQPREFRSQIKPYLPDVVTSPRFLPEVARRLGNSVFARGLMLSRSAVMEFVEKPLAFLVDVIRTIDDESRAALALIFMGGGSLESPISLTEESKHALELLGGTPAGVRRALSAMKGSLAKLAQIESIPHWMFKHPTIGDALASLIADDPELLDVYLTGTPAEKLLHEVSCGDVGIAGIRVMIPVNRYESFIERLDRIDMHRRYNFLAYRCDRDFLSFYLRKHPTIHRDLRGCIGSYLGAWHNVRFLARLHEFGLLPEESRLEFVEEVEVLAVETPDADFLSIPSIRSMLTDAEIGWVLQSVRHDLLENFSSCLENWEYNITSGDDPEEYFYPLIDALETFRLEFTSDVTAQQLIDDALQKTQAAIDNLTDDEIEEPDPDYEDYGYAPSVTEASDADRSIFDDVDQ